MIELMNSELKYKKEVYRMTKDKLNILIAENNRMTARFLKSVLGKQNNIRIVDIISNGKDVVEAVNKNDIDVLLLDLDLPNMSGFEIMGHMASQSRTKVLVLSAHTEEDFVKQSFNLGATGYMTKRAGLNEILEGIRTVSEGKNYFDNNTLRLAAAIKSRLEVN